MKKKKADRRLSHSTGAPNANCQLSGAQPTQALFGDDDRLAGDVEAFAAAHVLARHHVIFADHVVAGLGEAGAVALVGAAGELTLLGADEPRHFIFRSLVAVGTIQVRRLLLLAFVEKFAFFHRVVGCVSLVVGLNRSLLPDNPTAKANYYSFATDMLWQHRDDGREKDGRQEKSEAV